MCAAGRAAPASSQRTTTPPATTSSSCSHPRGSTASSSPHPPMRRAECMRRGRSKIVKGLWPSKPRKLTEIRKRLCWAIETRKPPTPLGLSRWALGNEHTRKRGRSPIAIAQPSGAEEGASNDPGACLWVGRVRWADTAHELARAVREVYAGIPPCSRSSPNRGN